MEPLALLGLVSLLLIKEAGLPIPVPGDLLVIGAGAALAADGPAALGGLAAILGAGYLGGTLQFTLMRRAGGDRCCGCSNGWASARSGSIPWPTGCDAAARVAWP